MKEIEQGTQEWLNLRKGKITASKIAVIMGLSPYQTPRQLWEEELGFRPPQKASAHMERGLGLEDKARAYFKEKTGIEVAPAVIFHPKNPKFMASLDGLSADKLTILEIKNNNVEYHKMAKRGLIVDFHQCQMQWQIYCLESDKGCYLSYRENFNPETDQYEVDAEIVPLYRDDDFIERAEKAAIEFLRMIDDLEEPPLIDADYENVSSDHELQNIVNEYREAQSLSKYYNDLSESHKKCIIKRANERNVQGLDWKMTKSIRKGSVDYEKLCLELNISDSQKETYRKTSSTCYRITLQ